MFTFGTEVNAEKLAKVCTRLFREYQIRKYYLYGINDSNSTDIMVYTRASDNNRVRLNDLKNLFARSGIILSYDWDGSVTKIGLKKKYRLIPALAVRMIKLVVFGLEGSLVDMKDGNLNLNQKFKIPPTPERSVSKPKSSAMPTINTPSLSPGRYVVRWSDTFSDDPSISGWETTNIFEERRD